MENNYNSLAERLDKIEGSVERIERAIIGDDFTNTQGIIFTVKDHNERLSSLERLVDRGKWLIIGLSATSGVGIYEIVRQLLNT